MALNRSNVALIFEEEGCRLENLKKCVTGMMKFFTMTLFSSAVPFLLKEEKEEDKR